MSDADYNVFVGAFVEKNHDRLVKTSTFHAKKIFGRDDYKENAHEILMAFVMHMYNNKERVLEVKGQGWLEQFSTVWIAGNSKRVYENTIKPPHQLVYCETIEEVSDKKTKDEQVLEQVYLQAEKAPPLSKENIMDLHSAGYTQQEIEQIMMAHLAAEESLTPSEKILFKLYFSTTKPTKYMPYLPEEKSYRGLEEQLGLSRTKLFRMVKVIEKKIKNKIKEYGATDD